MEKESHGINILGRSPLRFLNGGTFLVEINKYTCAHADEVRINNHGCVGNFWRDIGSGNEFGKWEDDVLVVGNIPF